MRRGFPITQAMRQERRKRAEDRNAEYNTKYPTLQAKLAALPATGCDRQRAKLLKRIEEAKAKPPVKQANKEATESGSQEPAKPTVKKYMKGKSQ